MSEAVHQQPCSEDVLISVYKSLVRYWISRGMSSDKAELRGCFEMQRSFHVSLRAQASA